MTAVSLVTAESEEKGAISIRMTGIGKSYKVYDQPFNFLREVLSGRSHHREKEVLRDITFEMRHKEIVGIIGRNGAGKSTLLKIIAGTLSPTVGTVETQGRVSAILELGTGFNPAYTGRENVILSALMRGMSEADVRAKLDGIVAFAGLEDVIDEPFHTYSSGMQGRLSFAAAVSVDADVIIIDEALSTGDARFAARSLRRIHEICQSGVTALFVSHSTYHVMQLCTRAIWIDDGKVRMDGAPIEVVRAYENEMQDAIARDQARFANPRELVQASRPVPVPAYQTGPVTEVEELPVSPEGAIGEDSREKENPVTFSAPGGDERANDSIASPSAPDQNVADVPISDLTPEAVATAVQPAESVTVQRRTSTGQYEILDIALINRKGEHTKVFRFGEMLKLRVSYRCLMAELPRYSCGLAVAFNRVSDFEAVMYFNTNYPHSDEELSAYFEMPFRKFIGSEGVIEATIDPIQLRAGEYFVSLGILPNQPGMHEFYEYHHCAFQVRIQPSGFDEPSVFYPRVSWTNEQLGS